MKILARPRLSGAILLACFAASSLVAIPATAQLSLSGTNASSPNFNKLTLAAALDAARNNFDVMTARRAVAASQADILAANHGPSPVLTAKAASIDLQNGVGSGNVFTDKRIDKSIGIDWTWERGKKRELRTKAAERAADAARADLDDVRIQQLIGTNAAYYDVVANREKLEHISEISASAVHLDSTARTRLKAGDISAQDAHRIAIEMQRAMADKQASELDLQKSVLALSQITGLAIDSSNPGVDPSWPLLGPAPSGNGNANLDQLIDSRPDVRAAVSRLDAAKALLETASAQRHADITWGASFDHYPGTSKRLVELRMQIPLQGVFGTYNYEGEGARAQAQLAQAYDALDRTRALARLEIAQIQRELQASATRAQAFETDILPRAKQIVAGAELAYARGASSLTDLLEARRTLRSTLVEAVGARADFAKAQGAWELRFPGVKP